MYVTKDCLPFSLLSSSLIGVIRELPRILSESRFAEFGRFVEGLNRIEPVSEQVEPASFPVPVEAVTTGGLEKVKLPVSPPLSLPLL